MRPPSRIKLHRYLLPQLLSLVLFLPLPLSLSLTLFSSFLLFQGSGPFTEVVEAEEERVDFQIQGVEVVTSHPRLKEKISRWLDRALRGKSLSQELLFEVHKNAREILSQNDFFRTELPDPEVLPGTDGGGSDRVRLKYIFDPLTYDYFVTLDGAKRTENYLEALESLNLGQYYSRSQNLAQDLSSKVKNFYLSKGFSRVQVYYEEGPGDLPYQRRVRITVRPGLLYQVEKVSFTGALSLPAPFYETQWEEIYRDLVGGQKIYSVPLVESALSQLRLNRQNEGYLRARVVALRTTYEDQKVKILIHFDEGPLTKIEMITFQGNKNFPESKLMEVINLPLQGPMKLNQLEESLSHLKSFYRESGFLEMEILNEQEATQNLVEYQQDNTLARIHYQIREGPRIQVGSIVVEGNTLTKTSTILKELEFRPGEILTSQKLEESTLRLQRLGLFSSVDIRTLEEKTPLSRRTIIVRVVDSDPGLFETGIGFNNERNFTLRGYLGLSHRNLGGVGRGLSARLDGQYNVSEVRYLEHRLALGYLEPYLFDTRIRGRINLTRSVYVSDFNSRLASASNQALYSIEEDITAHMRASWDLWNGTTVRDFYIDQDLDVSSVTIATTGPHLEWDFRDQPFNPSRGYLVRCNGEYGSPTLGSSSTIEFYRTFGNITFYRGFFKKGWVWAQSLRGGYLKNLNHESNGGVPYDKKGLTLGGHTTIRGFTPNEAFPNAQDLGTDPYLLTTEATMYLIKSELRFPISRFKSFDVGGAFFYDGGSVTVLGLDFNPTYRHSVGVSLRLNLPVGAIGIDFGWKLNFRKNGQKENPMVVGLEVGTF